jgi:hypothetical protein
MFSIGIRVRTFTSADAKNNFGELIDMARAAPVAITKYDRPPGGASPIPLPPLSSRPAAKHVRALWEDELEDDYPRNSSGSDAYGVQNIAATLRLRDSNS